MHIAICIDGEAGKENNAADVFQNRMSRDQRFKKNEGTPLLLLNEDSNTEVFSKSPKRKDMFGSVRSPLGRINENKIETEWEKSPENNVSPLKFNSSTDTFRLKENVNNQLMEQFSNKKLKEITDSENLKLSSRNVGFCPSISVGGENKGLGRDDMKKCPRGRSAVFI